MLLVWFIFVAHALLPINTNRFFNKSGRDADAFRLSLLVDPMIGYDSRYNSTIEYSYISLLRSEIHNIYHFPQKANSLVKFKDDSSDRNCAKPRPFVRLLGQYLTMINWYQSDYEKDKVRTIINTTLLLLVGKV